ncbi:hypothetical protein PIB30_063512 [Stylosanthes scabra]|uniref:Uncharacterized protein n=1 Tax=Stylosanthes scabra TaxID=79078 RepID=A0ABU6UK94_9FABA|nr:hypothetical protein [Stylosanthes scabra]
MFTTHLEDEFYNFLLTELAGFPASSGASQHVVVAIPAPTVVVEDNEDEKANGHRSGPPVSKRRLFHSQVESSTKPPKRRCDASVATRSRGFPSSSFIRTCAMIWPLNFFTFLQMTLSTKFKATPDMDFNRADTKLFNYLFSKGNHKEDTIVMMQEYTLSRA